MELENLINKWNQMNYPVDIVLFFHEKGKYGCFSNYSRTPFTFNLPKYINSSNDYKRAIVCDFSEKAIILCKAALMNDIITYNKLINVKSLQECKLLDKGISNFKEIKWKRYLCDIAKEVTFQKFSQNSEIRKILLSTKDAFIAKSSPYDELWGIGMHIKDERINIPNQWNGTNLLGWALMETRSILHSKKFES